MFNILCWNVRGAGGKKFKSSISDLVRSHKIDILIIVEPKVQYSKVTDFLRRQGFPDAEVVEAIGFSGGIWLLYDKGRVRISFLEKGRQFISVKVAGVGNHDWILTAVYANPNCTTV